MSKLIIKTRYATISNELLNREDISLKAKGLFAYLQSKPDNWNFSKERIAKQLKEGITSIKSAFKELKDNGYLETVPIKNNEGKFNGHNYTLFESPWGGKQNRWRTEPLENHTAISKKDLSKKEYSNKEFSPAGNPEVNSHSQIEKSSKDSSLWNHKDRVALLDILRKINPSLREHYKRKTTWTTIDNMFKDYGVKESLEYARLAVLSFGKKYAPPIHTPQDLYNKISALVSWYKKEEDIEKSKKSLISDDDLAAYKRMIEK